jgi:Calcineurin-like phosphoesterase
MDAPSEIQDLWPRTPDSGGEPAIFESKLASPVSWAQALEEARSISVEDVRHFLDQALLFEDDLIEPKGNVTRVAVPKNTPEALWYIGDLHGDLLALANAWAYIQDQSKDPEHKPHVLFLGDFVDRGGYSRETLLYLFRLIRDNQGRIGVLQGNHDEITWDEGACRFRSEVSPAEYVDGLNEILVQGTPSGEDADRIELGKMACEFFAKRPRAVFLPDGLLVAHAGFPHTDLQATLRRPQDLNTPACLQDFLWLRISDNAPRKRPNRGTKGCEFGYENFADFCTLATGILDIPTRRMLRGHEHPPSRYAKYPKYNRNPVVTINTMCRRLEDELSLRVEQFPRACVARHVTDCLPQIYQLHIDEAEIRAAYFQEPALGEPTPAATTGLNSDTNGGVL